MLSIFMLRPLQDIFKSPSRRTGSKAVLVGEPSRRDLEEICDVLNSKTRGDTRELRRLVAEWFASGPNLSKMLHSDFALWGTVQNSWTSLYIPSKTGRAYIALFPERSGRRNDPAEGEAHRLFAALTLNPQCNLLAGPCARCGSYYIKKTRRQKVYCSQRCGSAATALPAVRKKRADEQARKISLVRAALSQRKTTFNEQNWKQWVSRRTGLSVKWLSRAANRGELSPPR
jgi:hypothetical protein